MKSFEELLETQLAIHSLIQCILLNYNKLGKPKRIVTAVQNRLDTLQAYWEMCQKQYARLCAAARDEKKKLHEYFLTDKFLYINDEVEEIRDELSTYLDKLQPPVVTTILDDTYYT